MKNYDDEFDRYDGDEILDAEVADDGEYDDIIDGEYEPVYDRTNDKIGQVLDEIAELKRNIGSDNASRSYRSAQSEAELYDEINRLRGELADARRSQSLQEELGKMKEQLDRDSSEKNARLMAEIDDLKSRLAAMDSASETSDGVSADGVRRGDPALGAAAGELVAAAKQISLSARGAYAGQPDTTELMRRIIDVRLALGKLSQKEFEENLRLLSVYNALTAAKSAVCTTASSLTDKLDAMRKLDNEIVLSDGCYIGDVIDKYNELAARILSEPVRRGDVDVAADLGSTDKIRSRLTPDGRSAAVRFLALAGAVAGADDIAAAADKLTELVALKNTVQCDREKTYNDKECADILSLVSDYAFMSDASEAVKCAAEVRGRISKLCSLSVGDIIALPTAVYDKTPYAVPVHTYVRETADAADETARSSSPDELNLFLSEIVSLRDELQSYKDEVSDMTEKLSDGSAATVSEAAASSGGSGMGALMDEISSIRADMNDLSGEIGEVKTLLAGGAIGAGIVSENGGTLSEVLGGINEIKAKVCASDGEQSELLSVRDELLRELENTAESVKSSQSGDDILAGIEELKTQISDLRVYTAVGGAAEAGANGSFTGELNALRDEVSALRSELAAAKEAAADTDAASMREMLAALSGLPAVISGLKDDVAALRSEVAELKSAAPVPAAAAVPEDRSGRTDELVEKIYGDVRLMCDEPDYSVMNEILALREEYQRLKESINKLLDKPGRGDTDKLIAEIDSLRDQIFTINMASVSDGENQTYESYNNLIIDSLNEIRDDLRSVMQDAPVSGDAFATARLEKELRDQKETQRAIASLLNQTLDQIQKQGEMLKANAGSAAAASEEADKSSEKQDELLSEIEGIKYTLGVIQGNEKGEDADLEGSIAKLKKELSEVAGIINSEKTEKKPRGGSGGRSKKK